MSYLKPGGVEHLQLPSDPTYWVEMKLKASYGDKLAAQAAMFGSVDLAAVARVVEANGSEPTLPTAVESASFFRCLLTRLIIKWNLTDANDQVLDINEENIEQLDDEDGSFLEKAAGARLKRRAPDKQLPFEKASLQLSRATELETPKRRRR